MWRVLISLNVVAMLLGGCASVDAFREKHGFMPKHIKRITPKMVVVQPAPLPPPVVEPAPTQKRGAVKWLWGNRVK